MRLYNCLKKMRLFNCLKKNENNIWYYDYKIFHQFENNGTKLLRI